VIDDGTLVATHVEHAGEAGRALSGPFPGIGASGGPERPAEPTEGATGADRAGSRELRSREEADLLRRWMRTDGVRVRHADGACASPVAGGAMLSVVRTELHSAERANRGDEATLDRAKVRRRPPRPT
jgi:hypothetical protein